MELTNNIIHRNSFRDRKSFEEIFRSHYEELCRYAMRFSNDRSEAEEYVQAVFVKLWEKRASLKVSRSERAFLFAAVRNHCLNEKRGIKREVFEPRGFQSEPKDRETPDSLLSQSELEQRVEVAISELPEKRREVFLMSRKEGKKYREIADALNISVKTVENQMGSALSFLRERLRDYLIIFFFFTFLF